MNFMEKISLTKAFSFDAAHALDQYPGKCKHIHGHTYHLFVSITGNIIDEKGNPYRGMIIDFTEMKKWVEMAVLNLFDHALLIEQGGMYSTMEFPSNEKVYRTIYTPTCENMLVDIVLRLKEHIPEKIKLIEVRLQETPTAFATWSI